MFKARKPLALPFATLALLAACSSSSSTGTEGNSGSSHVVTSVNNSSAAASSVATSGSVATSVSAHSGSSGSHSSNSTAVSSSTSSTAAAMMPVPPTGAVAIATNKTNTQIFIQVLGLTTDDYIIYNDLSGGVSASDIHGTVTQIAPGPTTDGGLGPVAFGVVGNIVAVLTDYTTKSEDGETIPVEGTLSIWSHTQTGGKLVQVATNSTGPLSVATDSSYLIYMDGSDSTGTKGNIGVVSGAGTGATDLIKNVVIDTSSTTCYPWGAVDKGVVVTSTCALEDGGKDGTPQITAFSGASWTPTVLATGAAPSNLASGIVNFTTDTSGNNALTLVGETLSNVTLGSATPTITQLSTKVAAPTNGSEFFYLTPTPTYALFLDSTGALNKSTYTSPTAAPTTAVLNAGPIYGVAVFSPDYNWDVDYNTALDATTEAPSSLTLRNTMTGAGTSLVTNALAGTFGAGNSFTSDSKYVIWSQDLTAVGSEATVGSLNSQAVTATTSTQIVATNVWLANPLSGDNLIYSQNYIPVPYTGWPNGGASADIYTVPAAGPGPGTLVVSGADVGYDTDSFYVTSDKSHLFFSFTQASTSDAGGGGLYTTDGIYCVALPSGT